MKKGRRGEEKAVENKSGVKDVICVCFIDVMFAFSFASFFISRR